MRIIVTGATGFLGQTLVKRLVTEKFKVTALGRNLNKGALLEKLGATFVPIDLESETAFDQLSLLGPHDALIHAAALSSPWGKYSTFFRANVMTTQTMIKTARHLKCKRFIFISSPSIYFDKKDQINIKENFLLPKPINAYAATKRLAELDVMQAMDLSPVILRPRALYGEDDTVLLPRLVRALKKGTLPLLREGIAATNMTYIDDCVGAICLALQAPDTIPERIFNIAGHEPLMIRTIVEAVAEKTGHRFHWKKIPLFLAEQAVNVMELKARLTPGQPEPAITAYGLGVFAYSQTLDCTLAQQILGFTPKFNFEQGLFHVFNGTT